MASEHDDTGGISKNITARNEARTYGIAFAIFFSLQDRSPHAIFAEQLSDDVSQVCQLIPHFRSRAAFPKGYVRVDPRRLQTRLSRRPSPAPSPRPFSPSLADAGNRPSTLTSPGFGTSGHWLRCAT